MPAPKHLPLRKRRDYFGGPKVKAAPKRAFISYRPMVRSRHPSHSPLRKLLSRLPFRSVVRLGSTWAGDNRSRVECNPAAAVRISADKLLMKRKFAEAEVKTAAWFAASENKPATIEFPLIAKHRRSSRGEGIYLLKTQEEYNNWRRGKTLENYIVERFHDFTREYRLHVTKDGCFYTCRKMLRSDVPKTERWYRNDSNCNWIMEENPLFDKPSNWTAIVAESVKALRSVGLDIGAIDVKVQSAQTSKGKNRQAPEFIILETNSAPSFGEITLQKYLVEIPRLLRDKH